MARDERGLAIIAATFGAGALACILVWLKGGLTGFAPPPLDLWFLAAVAFYLPALFAFIIWFLRHVRTLNRLTGTPVSRVSLFLLFLAPVPLGGLIPLHVFAVQMAAARELRGLDGIDPTLFAALMILLPPLGWLAAQREMERITGPNAPPTAPPLPVARTG